MNLGKLFKDFHLDKVKLNLKAVQFEVSFREADKDAAWDLYVEMLTRIVTQTLPLRPVMSRPPWRACIHSLRLPVKS